MSEDSVCESSFEFELNFKTTDMDKFYDKFPHRNTISCTYRYSKLNILKDGYS